MRLSKGVVAVVSVIGVGHSMSAGPIQHADDACSVTAPNGVVAGLSERREGDGGYYGNALLSVGPFGLWPNGTVVFRPGGPGFVTRDGALGMKFGWTRGVRGPLTVAGHRLDGAAAPLRLDASDGYGDIGFQASYVIFSTPGCWEVTAQVGEREDSKITFVTKVVKIGEGPAWRRDPSNN
jgi:hypothetical protein